MRPDEPIDLSPLRTDVPLRDADYAAIRARVRSEIARPRGLALWLRFALAAAAIVIVAILVLPRKQRPTDVVQQPTPAAIRPPAHVPSVITPPAPPTEPQIAESQTLRRSRPLRVTPRPTPNRSTRHPRRESIELARQQPMRIELTTDDPEIRIIWIVQPQEPKENNS